MSDTQWWQPHRHLDRRPALLARNRIQRAIRGWLDDNQFLVVDPASPATKAIAAAPICLRRSTSPDEA